MSVSTIHAKLVPWENDVIVILQIFKLISRRAFLRDSCEVALSWILHDLLDWWLVNIGSGNLSSFTYTNADQVLCRNMTSLGHY